jgi:DnaJ-domain-containing protein 1
MAMGLPREFISVANDRLASINAAYDRVKAQRNQ